MEGFMKKALVIIGIIVLVIIAGGGIFVGTRTVSDGSDYVPPHEVIEAISGLSVIEQGGVRRFGDAWVEKRGADYLLHLSGTPYEMGYQHGILMADEIKSGTVPVFADPVSHNASFADKPAWVRRLLLTYLELSVYGPIERNTPREYLEEIKGIADGAGLDFKEVFIANFLSDLTMAMTPGVLTKKAEELGARSECSSFVAAGDAAEDGALIVGRNTDYSGQGRWVPYQTIFFYRPKGGLAYVNVGTAGLIKANSAMNEAGMVVSGHYMAFEGADPAGVSFTVLENEIMRKAKTLDEAIALLESAHRGGSFGLVIADGAAKEAAVVESTPERLGVRKMENGAIVLTNFATTEELKPVDLLLRYNVLLRNVMGRYERLTRLIETHRGEITPALAAAFMSDHGDVITGTERGTGITVCSDNNVTSAVFAPGSNLFWVAGGGEPACINDYVGYDFSAELTGAPGNPQPALLTGYAWEDPAKRTAFELYMKAYIAYEADFADKATALEYLREALATDPGEPIYARMAGILSIHLGDYQTAIELFIGALTLPQAPNEAAMTHLLLGWAYDLSGNRDQALVHYREVGKLAESEETDPLMDINGLVVLMARKGMDAPFSEREVKDIPIGFNLETGLE
jgi:isopenicillin-N N-acyltransferase like protein